ncbi:putative peptidase cysteine serine trypsin-like protein [Diplodia seriata]|uniref:Putative peptidase cysteine serine trypsin-like protein n=1 Tax=Diplodia seriata TaxID=420778 RepID=A0A0G2E3M7_9PEZI|nr:putative peptidase cysteine serine trypsin-like protein [Diplodia seriata]
MSNPWRPSGGESSSAHPESPKNRRKAAKSDEDVKVDIVEARFRTGWPKLDTTGKYDGNIHVEIVEFGSDTPRIFPIHADDDILDTWRNLGESVVSGLARYQVHWKLLSLVKLSCRPYGANAGPPTTTMLIEAWDPDADDWELKILPGLKGLIKNSAIENVEIWQAQGHSSDGGGKLNVANLPERTWWETPLRIGDGLGPQDIPSTGTLGGFVRIEDPVKKVESICILTNCHVVMPCPGLTEQMTPNPPETALKALNITETPLSHIVMSPSYPDLKEKIELLELDIQGTKEEAYGPLPPGALPPLAERAQWGDKKAIRALQVSKEIIDRLEAQSKTTDVMKVGRATGWTQGEINHAEAWMNLTRSSNGITWEKEYGTVVECMRVENPRGPLDPFSIGDDSGSMVVDTRDGACVGLVFGGNEGGTYALMTPIEDVFSSIEKVTGCRIVMPRLVA